MTQDDRNELFNYSMRDFTYHFLASAEYTKGSLKSEIESLVRNNYAFREDYRVFKKIEEETFLKRKNKLAIEKQKADHEMQPLVAEIYNSQKTILINQRNLKNLVDQLKNDSAFWTLQKTVEDLSLLHSSIGNEISNSDGFKSVLLKFKEISKREYDGTVSPSIELLQDHFIYIKKLIELEERVDSALNLTVAKDISNDLKNLNGVRDNIKSQLDNQKKTLKSQLNALIDAKKKQLDLNPVYTEFKTLMEQTKTAVKNFQKVKFDNHKSKKKQFKAAQMLDMKDWQIVRVNPQDMISIPSKLFNLRELMSMNPTTPIDTGLDNNLKAQIQAFYQSNNTRMENLTAEHDNLESHWENLKKLKENEKVLDQIFGQAIASLQMSSPKCFSSLELSFFMYYASVTQVVINKKVFLRELLENIPENDKINLINELFQDIDGNPLHDTNIIISKNLTEHGVEYAVNSYNMRMSAEINKIFKQQMSQKEKIKGIANTVLSYVGLSCKTILKKLSEIGAKKIFMLIIASFASVIMVSFLPFLLSLVVVLVAAVILKLLSVWLGAAWKKYEFQIMEGISDFISKFSNKEIKSLDYNVILEEYEQNEWQTLLKLKKLKKPEDDKEDKTKHFKEKFIEAIQMSIDEDTIKYSNIYEHLM
jgi:hypothetical protein